MAILYRYQTINEYTLQALESGKYWAAKPSTFNDPFEFKLKAPTAADIQRIKGVSEIRKMNPHLDKLSDFEVTSMANQYLQKTIENFGVICFTETSHSILMWSHYSNCHRGMCLGFDIPNTDHAGVYKVEYSRNYPDLDFGNIWHKDGVMKILWTKSPDWSYEKEWRLITVEGNKLEDYKGRLSQVIFGCRTSDVDKEEIRTRLGKRSVKFFDARIDDAAYKINIHDSYYR